MCVLSVKMVLLQGEKQRKKNAKVFLFHYYFSLACFQTAQNHFTTRAPHQTAQFLTLATAVKYLNFQTYSISTHFSMRIVVFFCFKLQFVVPLEMFPIFVYLCHGILCFGAQVKMNSTCIFASSLAKN